ncbi:MAG: hypothetical protein IJV02_00210 [Candidatus Methanomethylophilaceae archaeon]|nr:hypothetical protein [Candidatus Methanomethylophilaceae archaeon]MBR1452706.1 hypothetical protein [Candidatus Methanomethylophilaceae archaeon]
MTNTVNKVTEYLKSVLNDVITQESKTTALQADPEIVRATSRAGTIELPTVTTTSLGNYSGGYAAANGSIAWTPYTLTHDRSAVFDIDRREDNETAGVFNATKIASEFVRSQVVPEIDATRIAAIVNAAATKKVVTSTNLAKNVILDEIGIGLETVADVTGKDEGLIIYMNRAIMSMLRSTTEVTKTRDVTSGKRTLDLGTMQIDGNQIVPVPSARMFHTLTYNAASSAAGFTGTGVVNFVIATPEYAQGVVAFEAPKFIAKEVNQNADADRYAYRIFHDCFVPSQKVGGFYANIQTAISS